MGDKIIINLNNNKANETDLVHEYLHLFFFALKYKKETSNLYESILLEFKKNENIDTNNINELEEMFVTKASSFMYGNMEAPDVNFNSFLDAFNKSLENLNIRSKVNVYNNIFNILNKDMGSIFKSSKKVFGANNNIILLETNFKEWLNNKIEHDNNFEINCGNG